MWSWWGAWDLMGPGAILARFDELISQKKKCEAANVYVVVERRRLFGFSGTAFHLMQTVT